MHFDIHVYIWYDYVMGFHLMVMLRSTTGPYGRPVIEVAYGEMILSLHRSCMGDDSSGRMVGVSAWYIAYVWHTQVNTSVSSVYIFSGFSRYKHIYMYIFCKTYMLYKRTQVVSDLVLTRWDLENVVDRPWNFKYKTKTTDDFMTILYKRYNFYFIMFYLIYEMFD